MKRIIITLFVLALAIGVFTPVTFSLTQHNTIAVQTTTAFAQTAAQEASDAQVYGNIGSCGVVFGSMGNCIAYIFYFIPFYVGGGILNVSARFLDFTATLTLSSKMFSSAGFLETGWALMRDFANMFFIFILLYIALCIMLGIKAGGADPKHMIVSVVLIAIVINFSMFVTDVIIDTSNTLALVFYNQITIKPDPLVASSTLPVDTVGQALQTGTPGDTVPPKQIGLSLASSFHPAVFTSPAFWSQLKGNGTTIPPSRMILILLIMGILYFVVAWSFLVAAFSFMGRMVELFVLIIFSPIAFVSFIVPGMRGMDRFGWSTWWKSLIKTAFAAPIYFLLILLITLILNAGLFKPLANAPTGDDAWIIILVGSVLVPAVFLWIMLTEATKYAQKASGTVGEKLGGMASAAVKGAGVMAGGAVLGAASGGMAVVGRQTIGRAAENISSGRFGSRLRETAEGSGMKAWLARKTLEVSKDTQKSSFDVRQTGAGQKFAATTGMKMDSFGTFSIAASKGGRESQKARQAAENERKRVIMQNKNASKPINKMLDKRKVDLEAAKGKLAGFADDDAKAKRTADEEERKLTVLKNDLPKEDQEAFKKANKIVSDGEKQIPKAEEEKAAADEMLKAAEISLAAAEKAAMDKGIDPRTDSAYVAALAKRNDAQTLATTKDVDLNSIKEKIATSKQTLQNNYPDIVKQMAEAQKAKEVVFGKLNKETGKMDGGTKNAYEHQKHSVHEIEHGKNMEDQRKLDPVLDEKGRPSRDDKGNIIYKKDKDGNEITKENVMQDMSIHQLEAAATNSENGNFKEKMFNDMSARYKNTKANRDNLGNITTFNATGAVKDRTKNLVRNQAIQTAIVSAAPAFAAGTLVGGPLVGLAAGFAAAATGFVAEKKRKKTDKEGNDIKNLDTQLDASNTVMGSLKPGGKPVEKHDAEKDSELTTILFTKPLGAVGEVIGKTVAASGLKIGGGGGGHAKAEKAHAPKADSHAKADHGHGGGGHGAH